MSVPGGGKGPPDAAPDAMPSAAPSAAPKRFLLRLNPALYDVMEQWAADELRSVNAQIEFLLRQAARQAGRLPTRPRSGRRG